MWVVVIVVGLVIAGVHTSCLRRVLRQSTRRVCVSGTETWRRNTICGGAHAMNEVMCACTHIARVGSFPNLGRG
jgi:hypothetical protein